MPRPAAHPAAGRDSGLNAFVLYFALPCMLQLRRARTPIGQLLDGSVALVWVR